MVGKGMAMGWRDEDELEGGMKLGGTGVRVEVRRRGCMVQFELYRLVNMKVDTAVDAGSDEGGPCIRR